MSHEKYKHGSEDDLRQCCAYDRSSDRLNSIVCLDLLLKNFVAANPAKSIYGFTLNRKRAGHFSLCFLANKNATVQTWVCSFTNSSQSKPPLIRSFSPSV